MSWTFYVRSLAAIVLVACLFLPLSTCTHQGKTRITVPIHDLKPLAYVLLVFCWPVILLVAEAFRPRLSTSGIMLVFLQPLLAAATGYQIRVYVLFEKPKIGAYLSVGALAVIFVAALVEGILRVRTRRRERRGQTAPDH
jgi:hypothetical protein